MPAVSLGKRISIIDVYIFSVYHVRLGLPRGIGSDTDLPRCRLSPGDDPNRFVILTMAWACVSCVGLACTPPACEET
jgi:hypothetical protein